MLVQDPPDLLPRAGVEFRPPGAVVSHRQRNQRLESLERVRIDPADLRWCTVATEYVTFGCSHACPKGAFQGIPARRTFRRIEPDPCRLQEPGFGGEE